MVNDAAEPKLAIQRFNVLRVAMSAINLRIATTAILEALTRRQKGYVCLRDVNGVVRAQSDPEFRRILNSSFLNTPNGMPLVWLGRRAVGNFVDRVYGPDLMLEVFQATQGTEFRHFFYGGAPGVAEALKTRLESRLPKATICGVYCPPFRPLNAAEESEFIALIREKRPDIIWVGAQHAKAGVFLAEYLPKLDTPSCSESAPRLIFIRAG